MTSNLFLLLLSTFSVGVVHTLVGPDHYLPFIVLSRSRNWSYAKTFLITLSCGIGHVASAVLIGLAGALLSGFLNRLEIIESVRGDLAAWALISFGLVYMVWGIRSALRNKTHSHNHPRDNEKNLTPWILFIIFFLGPCEPLIPLVLYPAVQASALNIVLTVLVFGFATLIVMLGVVTASAYGLKRYIKFPFMERFGNALAGGIVMSCGLAMTFLGL